MNKHSESRSGIPLRIRMLRPPEGFRALRCPFSCVADKIVLKFHVLFVCHFHILFYYLSARLADRTALPMRPFQNKRGEYRIQPFLNRGG